MRIAEMLPVLRDLRRLNRDYAWIISDISQFAFVQQELHVQLVERMQRHLQGVPRSQRLSALSRMFHSTPWFPSINGWFNYLNHPTATTSFYEYDWLPLIPGFSRRGHEGYTYDSDNADDSRGDADEDMV